MKNKQNYDIILNKIVLQRRDK